MKLSNLKHKKPCLFLVLSLLMLPVNGMAETIIYADDFNRTGDLHASSPDTTLGSYGGTAGATWTAGPSTLTGTDAPFTGNCLAYLPFIPETGQVYTLTIIANDISWGAPGFTTSATPSTTSNMNALGAPAWILYQNNVANLRNGGTTINSSSAGGTGYNTITLVLDTTGTNWSMQGSMNGTPYGSPYTFPTNPTINAVAISGEYGGAGMTVDSFSLTVGATSKTPTTTALVSSANPASAGDNVTFTATVKVNGEVVPSLPGSVEFKVDDTVMEAAVAIDSVTGQATYSSSTLTAGEHTITATYSGDEAYATSSNSITQTMTQPFEPVVTTRGDGYTVATFATVGTGTWTIPDGVTSVEILVLGGGGAGGARYGAGGGAGGLVYCGPETPAGYLLTPQTGYAVTPGSSVTVTVGAGGPSGYGAGANGGNSQFDNLIAKGGQGGPATWNVAGGQAGYVDGEPYQGYAGGLTSEGGAGAGGGAGGIGGVDARGGIGLQIGITGSPTYYGGGGGSIGAVNSSYNLGGLGGGGNGSATDNGAATAGEANTGGGGGGCWGYNAAGGGAGGSGVVIVAYQTGAPDPYDAWAGTLGFNLIGGKYGDDDGDGLTNFEEFAFGLDPTSGASANPITDVSALDSLSQFTYTRLANSGLTYTIWTSTDLIHWDEADASIQEPGEADESTGVQSVLVEVNPMPDGTNVFVRVKAGQAP